MAEAQAPAEVAPRKKAERRPLMKSRFDMVDKSPGVPLPICDTGSVLGNDIDGVSIHLN